MLKNAAINDEYNAFVNARIERVKICYNMYSLSITIFGVLITVGVQFHVMAAFLIYPWVALFLALSWTHNSLLVYKVSEFLNSVSTVEQQYHSMPPNSKDTFFDYSNKLIFGITSVASLISGDIVFPNSMNNSLVIAVTWLIAILSGVVPCIVQAYYNR